MSNDCIQSLHKVEIVFSLKVASQLQDFNTPNKQHFFLLTLSDFQSREVKKKIEARKGLKKTRKSYVWKTKPFTFLIKVIK